MVKVYIDPGHGGVDPGAVGHGLREKDLTLSISKYARDYLLDNYSDVQVRMSRTTDTTVSLSQRASGANSWNADVFVSVHINAATSSATGYEDFIFNRSVSERTQRLQDFIHEEVSEVFSGFPNRGQKRANFYVLRNTRMSGVLTENLFITNRNDADFLRSDSNLRKIGEAHARGIARFLVLKPKVTASSTLVQDTEDDNIGKSNRPAIGKVTIMSSTLNIRTGTSTKYRKVGTAKKGEVYEVYRFLNGWANIGNYRWVSNLDGERWTKYEPYAVEDITSPDHTVDNRNGKGIGYAVVNANVLNIRTGTTTAYQVKGKAYKGDKFEVYKTLNGWLNIGKYRWISNKGGSKWTTFVRYDDEDS